MGSQGSGVHTEEPSVIPPPGTREIIDKAIPLILSGGNATANRLLLNKPTVFAFLNTADPFHKWYEWRLDQVRRSGVVGQAGAQGTAERWVPREPNPLEFCASQPPMSSRDFEIMKLTALNVAQDDSFLEKLLKDPGSQDGFRFTKKNSSLHSFFQSLVQQYKKVLDPTPSMKQRLEDFKGRMDLLERAVGRAEYWEYQADNSKAALKHEEKENLLYAQIDWQDFVVVETVDFQERDLSAALPKALSKSDVEYASIEKRSSLLDFGAADASSRPDAGHKRERLFVSPFTGEEIPASKFDEHLRIMTLDPRWRDQKKLEQQRQSNSNLTSAQVTENLGRITGRRGPQKEEERARKRRK